MFLANFQFSSATSCVQYCWVRILAGNQGRLGAICCLSGLPLPIALWLFTAFLNLQPFTGPCLAICASFCTSDFPLLVLKGSGFMLSGLWMPFLAADRHLLYSSPLQTSLYFGLSWFWSATLWKAFHWCWAHFWIWDIYKTGINRELGIRKVFF